MWGTDWARDLQNLFFVSVNNAVVDSVGANNWTLDPPEQWLGFPAQQLGLLKLKAEYRL
jgi:hypothetical protein